MAKEALTSTIRLEYREDRILRITILPNARIDIQQARQNWETAMRLIGNVRVAVLVDATAEHQITRLAQEFAAEQSHHRVAMAVITQNTITRLVTTLYVAIFRPSVPVKLFSSPSAAEGWLRQQLLDEEMEQRIAG
ncbi:MAG: hypothetical protein MUC87_13585 [Bacteroidia bacterium]|jgi:hypothetical protein|nr:hypothetical protein [Bacteroidia bacterium]